MLKWVFALWTFLFFSRSVQVAAQSPADNLWKTIQSDTFPHQLQYSQEKITAQKMLEELSTSISNTSEDYFQSLKTVLIYQSLSGNFPVADSLIRISSRNFPERKNELTATKLFLEWLPCAQYPESDICLKKKKALRDFLKNHLITKEHNEAMKWYWIGQMLSDSVKIERKHQDFIFSPQLDTQNNPLSYNGAVVATNRNPASINLLVSNDYREPLQLFEIDKKGTWTNITKVALLDNIPGGSRLYSVDINNDGFQDIVVLRNLPPGNPAYLYPSLLMNQKDGTYRDISTEAGLNLPQRSICACFLDANEDGRLDIFLGGDRAPSLLFIQSDSNKFIESAGTFGIVTKPHKVVDCAALDINKDHKTDLLLSTYNYTNLVYEYQKINHQYHFFVNQSQKYDFHLPYKGGNFMIGDFDGDQQTDVISNTDHSHSNKDVVFNLLSGKYAPDEYPLMRNLDNFNQLSPVQIHPLLTYSNTAIILDKGENRPYILSAGGRSWDEWYPLTFYQLNNDSGKHSLLSLPFQPAFINSMTITPLPKTNQPVIWMKGGYPNTALKNKLSTYLQAGNGGKFIQINLIGKVRKDALGATITVVTKDSGGKEIKRARIIQVTDSQGKGAGQNIWLIPYKSTVSSIEIKWSDGQIQIINKIEKNKNFFNIFQD